MSNGVHGFIDFKIRIEKKRAGDFMEDLARMIPYAQCVNYSIAIPTLPALPSLPEGRIPTKKQRDDYEETKTRLTNKQREVYAVLQQGPKTREDVEAELGMPNALRVLNNLKKFKLIKGNINDGYELVNRDHKE